MNEKQLAELLKHSSPKVLYAVAWNNLLKQLYCPFRVAVRKDIGELKEGQLELVEMVKVTMEIKMVYVIKGQYYYYYHFDILVDE